MNEAAADDLIQFWARANGERVHPDDSEFMRSGDFETKLRPVPWAGPLSARIFILFLNPGLTDEDTNYELNRSDFTEKLKRNLLGNEPYLYLHPNFHDHPGNRWARQTFGDDIDYRHAAEFCILQLVPYHSRKGGAARNIAKHLPSSEHIRRFAQENLLPRAKRGEIAVVVARSWKLWQIPKKPEFPNVVIYERSEPRRAFQTRNSRGGKLLRRMLNLPTGD